MGFFIPTLCLFKSKTLYYQTYMTKTRSY